MGRGLWYKITHDVVQIYPRFLSLCSFGIIFVLKILKSGVQTLANCSYRSSPERYSGNFTAWGQTDREKHSMASKLSWLHPWLMLILTDFDGWRNCPGANLSEALYFIPVTRWSLSAKTYLQCRCRRCGHKNNLQQAICSPRQVNKSLFGIKSGDNSCVFDWYLPIRENTPVFNRFVI